jgi:hypothetical protein
MSELMPALLVVLILLVVTPVAARFARERLAEFVAFLSQEVEVRGGTVLRVEVVRRRRGPFRRHGKGPRIVKLIYRDATGGVRQLWARRSPFGNELVWDYDDGDSLV